MWRVLQGSKETRCEPSERCEGESTKRWLIPPAIF